MNFQGVFLHTNSVNKLIKIFGGVFICLFFFRCESESKIINDLKKGETYLESQNLDSALYAFEEVLELDSNNLESINALAEIHFRKVEIGKALNYFEKSVQVDSTNAEIHLKIAEIKLFLGDYKSVFTFINNALRLNEQLPQGYFMKGVAYKHIGDTSKAISSFKTAVEVKHDFAKVYYELGLLLTLQKDTSAIDYYKNGIAVSPKDDGLYNSLAWSYKMFGKDEQSEKVYLANLKRSPNDIISKYNYALIKHEKAQNDTALILLNEVLVINPNDINTLNLKGVILSQSGDFSGAQEVAKKLETLKSEIEL